MWALAGSDRLGNAATSILDDEASLVFASTVSVWEVAIKWSLRRGAANDMPLSPREFVEALSAARIDILNAKPEHAVALDDLPLIHADPFDRLLLATARHEKMVLLTRDATLAQYRDGVRLV